ncbi:decarboxylating NADP(+)-dependent phosphogluconate dehydrogenase [Pectinatus frisingensis]|jgi:6-phosphogluconate dehydrogenase|uniref:decarboxylating NADP(+)-dependent phosphogluconate dehydrogenase n=1 Tax=Pectinatus frisingensis TaxID=865 RepID=UPI0015F6AB48|nr:decarboxylating NADP(+)-dependent phosphogluconate dehydrogenase [Pectinatus frisingensis]
MPQMDIGIIGMAVMGSNLALNMADHGFKVAAYNRTAILTKEVIEKNPNKNMTGFYTLADFINSLQHPRKIMLMIKAGKPVDMVIDELLPYLDRGDIIIDGGNSYFEDTIRRHAFLQEKDINYFGVGISGGEKGARFGPSIMPGGNKNAYSQIQPILEAISAHVGSEPCCTYIGENGAGHYVKMVHNGIEYADMQLIAEAYLILHYIGGFDNKKLSQIFHEWNEGELHSYLIGITADIFAEDDPQGGQVIDKIIDSAGQKGTGRWTSIQSLKQGVDISMITAACNTRVVSNLIDDRQRAANEINIPTCAKNLPDNFIEEVRKSLYVAKIIAYAQGFSLYRSACKNYNWQLNFAKIAAIFRAGCIIQAEFLNKITLAYEKNENLSNLMFDEFFLDNINTNQSSLRRIICLAVNNGIPIPAFSNALQYIDAHRSPKIGANLIQAQRDYFGAHTFERIDKPGTFHHEWQEHYSK